MKMNKKTRSFGLFGLLALSLSTQASDLTIPNQFTSGTRAVAADVNANFDAAAVAVTDNQAQLTVLIAQIAALTTAVNVLQTDNSNLQAEVDTLQADSVAGLSGVLAVGTDNQGDTAAIFSGVNLHVNNGTDDTSVINGLGNLIVGYDEGTPGSSLFVCSYGLYTNQTDCEGNGEVWSNNHKSGSHNLVIGRFHDYSQYGGFVAGEINDITGIASGVFGGRDNKATGDYSTVSGGKVNKTTGQFSSISGGQFSTASGESSSVTGGTENEALAQYSTVTGGILNQASGSGSSISGGQQNIASEIGSSVSGGGGNEASGSNSAVSGGVNNTASGELSSVSGGNNRDVIGIFDWRAGTLFEDN